MLQRGLDSWACVFRPGTRHSQGMCGRYTLTSLEGLIEEFGLIQPPSSVPPRFNIAPSERVPVIDNRPREQRVLTTMRWGLIPYWAKDPTIGNKLINARRETAAEKPAFRDALRRRRCLIVADGFYEWKREGKRRTPFYVRRRSGGPMAFAGLWERWRAPDGELLHSFTILTTGANELMAPVHDRMPIIVDRADYDRWLEPSPVPPAALAHILVTPPSQGFDMYEVSRLVNSPRNDTPACIQPIPEQRSLL
jgi:putative SOS response-associated peptidase YedK